MKEIWKDVKDYEGFYQISNFGRVKSLERYDSNKHKLPERIMNPNRESNGYYRVYLCRNGKAKRILVHRLVAEAFVERKHEGDNIVNHLDNNPSNNRADNLEWTTYKGNMQWAAKQGRMKANASTYEHQDMAAKSRRKAVVAISPDGERLVFESQAEAGRQLRIGTAHIAAACRKEYGYKKLNGFEFEYADQELQKSAKPKREKMSDEDIAEYRRKKMIGNKINVGRKCSLAAIEASKAIHSKPILQMDKEGNIIADFSSVKEAKEKTGILHAYDVANGKRKSAGGYLWKWKGEGL